MPTIQRRPLNETEIPWIDVDIEFFKKHNIPFARVVQHLESGGIALLTDEQGTFEYRLKPE